MNIRPAYMRRHAGRALVAAALAFCCTLFSACDSAIYDDEGNCAVTYLLKFRYDHNMKWADAFSQEVESVHLYAFDKDSLLVWQHTESGEALTADDYAMKLDLPAGDYHLVAWCGAEDGGSFSVPEARVGQTAMRDLVCSLNRRHDEAGAHSEERLRSLFHGLLDVTLPANEDGGTYSYKMNLTKDTNHVRVILQHLSGETVDVSDFVFRVEEENGLMKYDNSLLPDELIAYAPYHTGSGVAGLGIDDYPEIGGARAALPQRATVTSVSVAIADFSLARLMADRHTYLTIDTKEGERVARIPLADYALLLKDGYPREMTAQEYLDRQDDYTLTFFLDEDEKWIATSIIINSWKVVLGNLDFE